MADNKANKEQVHRVFKIFQKYDRLNNIISFEQHKVWRKRVMKDMGVRKGTKALDVCCGTGDWTIALSKAVGPTGEVTGIDFSENMLEVGKEKLLWKMLNLFMVMQWNCRLKTILLIM